MVEFASTKLAGKHTVSGLLKLLYPNEQYDKEGRQAVP
jgi:predicted ATP-dependent Lon-type protease